MSDQIFISRGLPYRSVPRELNIAFDGSAELVVLNDRSQFMELLFLTLGGLSMVFLGGFAQSKYEVGGYFSLIVGVSISLFMLYSIFRQFRYRLKTCRFMADGVEIRKRWGRAHYIPYNAFLGIRYWNEFISPEPGSIGLKLIDLHHENADYCVPFLVSLDNLPIQERLKAISEKLKLPVSYAHSPEIVHTNPENIGLPLVEALRGRKSSFTPRSSKYSGVEVHTPTSNENGSVEISIKTPFQAYVKWMFFPLLVAIAAIVAWEMITAPNQSLPIMNSRYAGQMLGSAFVGACYFIVVILLTARTCERMTIENGILTAQKVKCRNNAPLNAETKIDLRKVDMISIERAESSFRGTPKVVVLKSGQKTLSVGYESSAGGRAWLYGYLLDYIVTHVSPVEA